MKTIIIGAQGMLGQELVKVFENYQPICWGRAEIDISNREDVNKKISEAKPKFIIQLTMFLTEKKQKDTKKMTSRKILSMFMVNQNCLASNYFKKIQINII